MSAPSKMGVKVKEDKDSKGKSGADATTFSLMGQRTSFHGPGLTLMGSQSHHEPVWKVTKADIITFLVIFVAAKQLVGKSPQGILSWYLGE